MLWLMEILFISLLLGSSLSFHSGLEAALSFADNLFYFVCMFSSYKVVLQGCCSTLSKGSAPSGLWHTGRKTKTKPSKPRTLHHRASCRDRGKLHRAGLDQETQAAISNLFPSITCHFWKRDMLFERVVSLAVECCCFCNWVSLMICQRSLTRS